MNIPLIIAALVLPYCIGGFIDNNSDKYSNSKLVHTWETTAAWLKGLLRNHSFGAEDVTNDIIYAVMVLRLRNSGMPVKGCVVTDYTNSLIIICCLLIAK